MTASLFLPLYVAIDGDGVPMAGAKLYFYTTGTTTPQATYTGADLLSPNTNPVVADADGLFPPIYLASGPDYKAILRTSADVTVATLDPIAAPAADDAGSGSVAMQGRLTLATSTPVMTSNQIGKTVVYYTPYIGNTVGLWTGSRFAQTTFAELANDLTASSVGKAGPAATANNSNYDLFVWEDAGTLRLTRGPAWTSGTARGTGGGTTELQRVQGILVNAQTISNGPAAGFGTYVGTIRTDGSAQANWHTGGVAAGGTAAILGVWNMYNRVDVRGLIGDSTNSWTYNATAIRAANNSSTMRVSFISGQQEDYFKATYAIAVGIGGGSAAIGLGLDVVNAFSGRAISFGASGAYNGQAEQQFLGFHFISACEGGDGTNVATHLGDNGNPYQTSGLQFCGRF